MDPLDWSRMSVRERSGLNSLLTYSVSATYNGVIIGPEALARLPEQNSYEINSVPVDKDRLTGI